MLRILCNSMAIVALSYILQLATCAITASFFVKHKADFVQSLVQCYIFQIHVFKNFVSVFPWSSTCPNERDPPARYLQLRIDVTLWPHRHRHRSLHRCPGCFESLCALPLDLRQTCKSLEKAFELSIIRYIFTSSPKISTEIIPKGPGGSSKWLKFLIQFVVQIAEAALNEGVRDPYLFFTCHASQGILIDMLHLMGPKNDTKLHQKGILVNTPKSLRRSY